MREGVRCRPACRAGEHGGKAQRRCSAGRRRGLRPGGARLPMVMGEPERRAGRHLPNPARQAARSMPTVQRATACAAARHDCANYSYLLRKQLNQSLTSIQCVGSTPTGGRPGWPRSAAATPFSAVLAPYRHGPVPVRARLLPSAQRGAAPKQRTAVIPAAMGPAAAIWAGCHGAAIQPFIR